MMFSLLAEKAVTLVKVSFLPLDAPEEILLDAPAVLSLLGKNSTI